MGFITDKFGQSIAKVAKNYESFGYLENPFPPKAQVRPEIYVERPELERLRQDLLSFLAGSKPGGACWALESEHGIGKSNFLQHVNWDLTEANKQGQLTDTVYQYIPSSHIEPRLLVEYLLQAIGEKRFEQLLKERPSLPESSRGTELYRFVSSLTKLPQIQKPKQPGLFPTPELEPSLLSEHTRFLLRWLGGHQIYTKEREDYNIWAKERMSPAVAFPYLRILIDCMENQGILKRIVLLLDEFEDVQTLKSQTQSEYIQALKGLLNSFNWRGLFVIIAGQSTSFATLGERYPSLGDRWKRVQLKALQSSADAVKLAKAYMEYGHQEYLKQRHSIPKKKIELSPSEVEIKAIYADMKKPVIVRQEVTQRDLLNELHDWLEKKASPTS